MRKLSIYATMAALLLSCRGSAEPPAPPQDKPYDIFLLIGQSNMAGRGYMILPGDTAVMEGVWLLNGDDVPEPAKNPLNRYSTVRKGMSVQRISPGTAFGVKVAAATGRKVLIVSNALGGSSIQQWATDAAVVPNTGGAGGSLAYANNLQLYAEAVRRTKEAMKYGTLKGILWHQGEANSSRSEAYLGLLKPIVEALRQDLNAPNVPFIAGELAYWRSGGTGSNAFNTMIRTISTVIPHSGWISAEGAGQLIDNTDPHFSRDGQLLLGERYADKVLEMCY